MEERRLYKRTQAAIRVELSHPSIGSFIGSTTDISDGGAQVSLEHHQQIPPVGTVLDVKFKKTVGSVNEEPVKMQVMHTHRNTMGLMFVK